MNLFYSEQFYDNELLLTGEESHHCVNVLRKNVGEEIQVTDGKGNCYIAVINEIKKKELQAAIVEKEFFEKPISAVLTIATAIPKSNNRLEYFMQKATEIGVDQIIPIITAHSERRKINLDRCRKILLSAMKQSFQYYLPKTFPIQTFRDVLEKTNESNGYITHQYSATKHIFDAIERSIDTCILIGPEGGFNEEEISLAVKNGYQKAHMGKNRLRTETAGVFACSAFQMKNR